MAGAPSSLAAMAIALALAALAASGSAAPWMPSPRARANKWVGVSESGLEFGGKFPGTPFKDYTQPLNTSVAYFAEHGFNIIRLPFLWERLQPTLRGDFDDKYGHLIDQTVQFALSQPGMSVLLDVHNYARYRGSVIGESGGNVTAADFADLWRRLAEKYGSASKDDRVLFGLMNEPHGMNTSTVLTNANAAIAAIRSAGARNVVTVCGNGYSGAHSWTSGGSDSNAEVMGRIVDPDDNFVYEMHQYLDSDSSGTHSNCTLTNASKAMSDATAWLRANGKAAILGEWAGANNSACHDGVDSMLNFLADNKDVWQGWVWWSAGPWWGTYMFNLEPNPPCPPKDKPQEAWLAPFTGVPGDSAPPPQAGPVEQPGSRLAWLKRAVDDATPEERAALLAHLVGMQRAQQD